MDEKYLNNYINIIREKRSEEMNELSVLSEISDNDYLKCVNERGFLYGSLI